MTRYAAFLRGINLGNRRLKMDALRARLDELGLANVGTYIASGNVVFDEDGGDPDELERRIERHLESALGYPVDTFVRELGSLERIVASAAVASASDDFNAHAIFLKRPVTVEGEGALRALGSDDDCFHVLGREVVWLRRGRLSDSPLDGRQLESAVGAATSTMRNLNTVRRMLQAFHQRSDE